MQFNSYIFILLFLPPTILFYFFANKINETIGKLIIVLSGVVFFAYADLYMCFVLCCSILINLYAAYIINSIICKNNTGNLHIAKKKCNIEKEVLVIPVVINVCLLLYYKYTAFLVTNINTFLDRQFTMKSIILPLGISFFTFQQIAYLVSVYRRDITDVNILDYLAFILFFPKLIMGPLMEPKDFIEQINNPANKALNWANMADGLKLFAFGLFKKMLIADTFAQAVSWGFDEPSIPGGLDWILISIFYTMEIYFDFSGYTDMATGAALMLNITLPINFDSPYKATSIRDFWKRWHISLTAFFTKYIYVPLGGSRKGELRTYINILIVFLISGLWHGANWTFILWGILHGAFCVYDRIIERRIRWIDNRLLKPLRWMCTFVVVDILWLLFRSESIIQWKDLLMSVFDCGIVDVSINSGLIQAFVRPELSFVFDIFHMSFFNGDYCIVHMWITLAIAFAICLFPENNYRKRKDVNMFSMATAAVAFCWAFLYLSQESVFIYNGF